MSPFETTLLCINLPLNCFTCEFFCTFTSYIIVYLQFLYDFSPQAMLYTNAI